MRPGTIEVGAAVVACIAISYYDPAARVLRWWRARHRVEVAPPPPERLQVIDPEAATELVSFQRPLSIDQTRYVAVQLAWRLAQGQGRASA